MYSVRGLSDFDGKAVLILLTVVTMYNYYLTRSPATHFLFYSIIF